MMTEQKRETKINAEKKPVLPAAVQAELDGLLKICRKNLKNVRLDMITMAFLVAYENLSNKLRKSGKPSYTHALEVAKIVANELPLDNVSVASALLHDIPLDSDTYTIDDIKSEFGETIAEIVDGIAKIQTIETQNLQQFENYRKLMLSLFKDVRIILIKIAERLHNMQTLSYLSKEKQKRLSEETLEIYVPFANRFGFGRVKGELEDLAFSYLNPQAYKEILDEIQLSFAEREQYINKLIERITKQIGNYALIKQNNIQFEINGRPKHIYSIYNKMIIRDKPLSELYDLFALRIILDTDDLNYCFIIYNIISKFYREVPETFKNYITHPKPNGYRSLHFAIFTDENHPVEIQVRTRLMHDIAEKGVAAHFNYKRGLLPAQSVLEDKKIEKWMEKVSEIFQTAKDTKSDELLEKLRIKLQLDEIYVFTPKNEFRVLPVDSTALDFAYAIHSELGNSCIGAKVNGRIAPLNYKLKAADRIEILTSKNQKPDPSWLNFVITTKARTVIIKHLREETKKNIFNGKRLWEKFKIEYDRKVFQKDFKWLLEQLNFTSEEDFFISLSKNIIDLDFISNLLKQRTYERKKKSHVSDIQLISQMPEFCELKEITSPVFYATCCYPIRGDKITAVMLDGKTITVHRSGCTKLTDLLKNRKATVFNIEWSSLRDTDFSCKIKIIAQDSPGILGEIMSKILSVPNISVKGMNFESKEFDLIGKLNIVVYNAGQLDELTKNISDLPGIKSIERIFEE